jgi:ribonuclease HI
VLKSVEVFQWGPAQ